MKAQHSSKTAEHGTPPHIIEHARNLMGGIDVDPASSALWNRRVKALYYYTKERSGLTNRWRRPGQRPVKVLLNPPSGVQGRLVQAFWLLLVELYEIGDVEQAVFVGFSLEQLASLQGITEVITATDREGETQIIPCPLDYPTVIPKRRLHYQVARKTGRSSRRSRNPPHASYVSWLPPKIWHPDQAREIFHHEVGYLGIIASIT